MPSINAMPVIPLTWSSCSGQSVQWQWQHLPRVSVLVLGVCFHLIVSSYIAPLRPGAPGWQAHACSLHVVLCYGSLFLTGLRLGLADGHHFFLTGFLGSPYFLDCLFPYIKWRILLLSSLFGEPLSWLSSFLLWLPYIWNSPWLCITWVLIWSL